MGPDFSNRSDCLQRRLPHRFARAERQPFEASRLVLQHEFPHRSVSRHIKHRIAQIPYRLEQRGLACTANRAHVQEIAQQMPVIFWDDTEHRNG